ncbi:MAG TPA: LytTR family DNA-binding domain-containing protein [Saprospiraceae bacterium]|nr:LytTR family DNA-binding domain-containing protein [Saprospiraceae bacterium]
MKPLTTILIDDEESATELLSIELAMYCPGVQIIDKIHRPEEVKDKVSLLRPDFIFMDIEMPGMDGFHVLEEIKHLPVEVVFITAYDRFALKAFQFSAIDYLLKPVGKNELQNAVEKVKRRIEGRRTNDKIEALLSNINFLKNGFPNLAVHSLDGIEFIPVDQIVYCAADNNYTQIHSLEGKHILASRTLKEIEIMLEDHDFLRIHQSYLINLRHLKKYSRGQGGTVIMINNKELPVSRSKKNDFLDRLW